MINEIKTGMEVQLKTGGPVMKVVSVTGETAVCQWHVVNRTCTQDFKTKYLVKAALKK